MVYKSQKSTSNCRWKWNLRTNDRSTSRFEIHQSVECSIRKVQFVLISFINSKDLFSYRMLHFIYFLITLLLSLTDLIMACLHKIVFCSNLNFHCLLLRNTCSIQRALSTKAVASQQKAMLDRIIRVDHAGELGADRIYAGQYAILKRTTDGPLIKVSLLPIIVSWNFN